MRYWVDRSDRLQEFRRLIRNEPEEVYEPPPEPKPLSWYASKRKAAKLQRTPVWADQKAIIEVYRKCYRLTGKTGIDHHVDHILPLQGEKVSGLHVAENLQVITATANMRKSNSYDC